MMGLGVFDNMANNDADLLYDFNTDCACMAILANLLILRP